MQSFSIGQIQRVVLSTTKNETVFGLLLLDVYVNKMKRSIQDLKLLIQSADDTLIFVAAGNVEAGVDNVQKGLKEFSDFGVAHFLDINADRTQFIVFIVFSKQLIKSMFKNAALKTGNISIKPNESLKNNEVHSNESQISN